MNKIPQKSQQQLDLELVRSVDIDPVCPLYGSFGSADPQALDALRKQAIDSQRMQDPATRDMVRIATGMR